jgi:hypothetical protein
MQRFPQALIRNRPSLCGRVHGQPGMLWSSRKAADGIRRLGFESSWKLLHERVHSDWVVEIYAEWGGLPTEVLLYKRSLTGARIEAVLSNVAKALNYLGHRVQISEDE